MGLGEAAFVSGGAGTGRAFLRLSVHQVNAALVADVRLRLLRGLQDLDLLFFFLFVVSAVWLPLAEGAASARSRRGSRLLAGVAGERSSSSSAADVLLGGLAELAAVATRTGSGTARTAETDTLCLAIDVWGLEKSKMRGDGVTCPGMGQVVMGREDLFTHCSSTAS